METYLRSLARTVIAECTFERECAYFGAPQPMRTFLPAGDNKYPSFWVRDCAMASLSGEMPLDDMKRYVEIIARCGQNGPVTRSLENGLVVPPYAVADHINFNGLPVYYPGTMGDRSNQGDGRFGILPPLDDNSFFVLMAAQYVLASGNRDFLRADMNGMTLMERLKLACEGYNVDARTGLSHTTEDMRAVDWGFTDTVVKTGTLLMPSLFRREALLALAALSEEADAAHYRGQASLIAQNVVETLFDDETGWFYSATGIGHQHDVWGTAYAVQSSVLDGERKRQAQRALAQAYVSGDAVVHGQIRHILCSEDASESSAWQQTIGPVAVGEYQNGAYWATPTGWYFAALFDHDRNLAMQLMQDFVTHTQQYEAQGAPFEHINPDTTSTSGARYGASAALPLAGWRKAHKQGVSFPQ